MLDDHDYHVYTAYYVEGYQRLLHYLKKKGLYPKFPVIQRGVNEPECVIDGKKFLQFCANNYLSNTENISVKQSAVDAIYKYGVGPGGSRVISGNVEIIEQLEKEIADMAGYEDCVTFPTGYMANVSVFKAMCDPFIGNYPVKKGESVILSDENNHGSIVDGIRLTYAQKIIYKHNNLEDLENKLAQKDLPNEKIIATEGVFSLEGEILDLPKYIELAKKYNAKLFVDDAHGFGLLGQSGGGIGDHYGLKNEIDIYMGCLDKATGGTGGFLCGKKEMIEYLRIATRSSLLSSALPTGMSGAMLGAIHRIRKEPKIREELFQKANYLREKLRSKGFQILGDSQIPSLPMLIGKEELGLKFSEGLFARGIYCALVRWPAVPEGQSRFRVIVMINHTQQHLDRFVEASEEVARELRMHR